MAHNSSVASALAQFSSEGFRSGRCLPGLSNHGRHPESPFPFRTKAAWQEQTTAER
jgi:hypothetical protein